MENLFSTEGLFTLSNFFTLLMLVLLQAVLGFDNLLYISLESKRAPEERRSYVRKLGIGLAVALRLVLLVVLMSVVSYFQDSLGKWHWENVFFFEPNLHALIVLAGGVFILYTALKEIWHMISLEEHEKSQGRKTKSVGSVITMIVIMNVVFSFDSILSAMALTDYFWIMAIAIIIGGVLMIWLADKVSNFLQKNRMYEVLGLFILFLVGVMLLSEGAHMGEMQLFGYHINAMSKATFYFVIAVLVIIDIVQGRYKKKLLRQKQAQEG